MQNGLISNQQILNRPISTDYIYHNFTYDTLNQLKSFTYNLDASKNQTYSYDADGNITWVNTLRYDYQNYGGKTNKLTGVTNTTTPSQLYYLYFYDYKGNLRTKNDYVVTPYKSISVTENDPQNYP